MCDINSSSIDFSLAGKASVEAAIKWLHFCQTVHVERCDLTQLTPPLSNLSLLLSQASYEDCMSPRELAIYCVSVILSVLILAANSVVLLVIRLHQKLQTITNIAMVSLALSDLLTGLTFMYSAIWNLLTMSAGYQFDFYKIQYYISMRSNYYLVLMFDGPGLLFTCLLSSVLSLVTIATERYVAIFYPYKYPHVLTKQRMFLVVGVVWVISLTVGILPLCGWNNYNGGYMLVDVMSYDYLVLWSTICFLSAFVILCIYIRIFFVARKHTRQIEARVGTISATFSTSHSGNSTADSRVDFVTRQIARTINDVNVRPRHSSIKAVKTIAIILGSFYICWIPFLIYLLVVRHQEDNFTIFCLAVVTEFNSLFNPLVYGLRNKEMRTCIVALLTCSRCVKR